MKLFIAHHQYKSIKLNKTNRHISLINILKLNIYFKKKNYKLKLFPGYLFFKRYSAFAFRLHISITQVKHTNYLVKLT